MNARRRAGCAVASGVALGVGAGVGSGVAVGVGAGVGSGVGAVVGAGVGLVVGGDVGDAVGPGCVGAPATAALGDALPPTSGLALREARASTPTSAANATAIFCRRDACPQAVRKNDIGRVLSSVGYV